jgi:hypothetical protein
MVRQHMHSTFMKLSLENVGILLFSTTHVRECPEIFLLEPKGWGRWRERSLGLFNCLVLSVHNLHFVKLVPGGQSDQSPY